MIDCKKCIHHEVCNTISQIENVEDCRFFSHKENWRQLPCWIGDTMYEIDLITPKPSVQKVIVAELYRKDWKRPDCWYIVVSNGKYNSYPIPETQIGKDLFRTKEEAEAELKRRYPNA